MSREKTSEGGKENREKTVGRRRAAFRDVASYAGGYNGPQWPVAYCVVDTFGHEAARKRTPHGSAPQFLFERSSIRANRVTFPAQYRSTVA